MTFDPKSISDTFCVLPWIHLSTRPDGSMRVCCTANASGVDKFKAQGHAGLLKNEQGMPSNLNNSDFLSSWNSEYMKNVRFKMLSGEVPASCTKCFKEEAAGHKSKRIWETNYWSKRVDIDALVDETSFDGSVPPKLQYIDLRFGNKCQLACVMCSPHDSSGWIKDWTMMNPKVTDPVLKQTMGWDNKGSINGSSFNWHKNNPKFWEQFYDQIPHMKQIYFAGGEPLIIEEHYAILEKCIELGHAKNLELRYNSNGVEWRDDIFDLWKHFKFVRFQYSVDDIGPRNEYIRYPSLWKRTEEVFHILDAHTTDNVEVSVACAVQALNVYYLPDFIQWKIDQGFKKVNVWPQGAGMLNYHFVYFPAHLNVKVLPKWFKQRVREKYNDFFTQLEPQYAKMGPSYDAWRNDPYGIKRLEGILDFMDSEDWSNRLPQTKQFLDLCDKQRKLSFAETFPEMANIFDGV
jgi:hypothetical protein